MENETTPPTTIDQNASTPTEGAASPVVKNLYPPGMEGIAEGYRRQSLSGARWFFWVAGLSIINSIVTVANGRWNFLAGLGITQVISGFALGLSEELGGAAIAIALVLDLIVAAIFVSLGLIAQKRHTWAFLVGMIVYALDGLIFLLVQDWLAIAFHAFVLFSMYRGLAANRNLQNLQAETLAQA